MRTFIVGHHNLHGQEYNKNSPKDPIKEGQMSHLKVMMHPGKSGRKDLRVKIYGEALGLKMKLPCLR